MAPRFLDQDLRWFACPVCKGGLALEDGAVVCTSCRRSYPVEDEIPILIAERALPPRQSGPVSD